MPRFERYIGIDYSGAQDADSRLRGLRIYEATHHSSAQEILPQTELRSHLWTRRLLAEWLQNELQHGPPAIVGIDHAFSFPLAYFEIHNIPMDWDIFLEDFHSHWPTDEPHTPVDSVRKGVCGDGASRSGSARWRRLTELRCGAKSVFHFDVPGSVAKSTHAGLPWLIHIRRKLGRKAHFWPFDGWMPPAGCSLIAEVYPSQWSQSFPRENRTPDQHDAFCVAQWLKQTDASDGWDTIFNPPVAGELQKQIQAEGWILGVA